MKRLVAATRPADDEKAEINMTKPLSSFLFFLLLLAATPCWASPIVTIGQTSILTEFNIYQTQFAADPNNPLPPPDPREAVAQNNEARVSLSAAPGQAGVAEARTAVRFDWDFQGHTWQEVRNLPVRVTFDFEYEMSALWTEGSGSASAGVRIIGFSDPWYDFIGHVVGEHGASAQVVETFTNRPDGTPLTVQNLGNLLGFLVYDQAHSAPDSGATNTSSSRVLIHSIAVQTAFVPEPGTLALVGLSLAGLAASRRRKQ